MSEFGALIRVKTRKPHRCEWCGEPIPVGSRVPNYRGQWQNEWQNWYMHEECHDAMQDEPYISEDGFEPYSNERPVVQTC